MMHESWLPLAAQANAFASKELRRFTVYVCRVPLESRAWLAFRFWGRFPRHGAPVLMMGRGIGKRGVGFVFYQQAADRIKKPFKNIFRRLGQNKAMVALEHRPRAVPNATGCKAAEWQQWTLLTLKHHTKVEPGTPPGGHRKLYDSPL